jgi:regulatory protein
MKKVKLGKDQARLSIRRFCAYQERAQQEVRDKLYEYGLSTPDVEELISELIGENFLNEARFAEQYAGGHFRIKQWGKLKIQYALQQKRVSAYNIKKALQIIDLDDYERVALELTAKKWKSLRGQSMLSKKQKTKNFMHQRGFEPSVIIPILNRLATTE